MTQSFRQQEILEIAKSEGRVTVEGLALSFGVTLQTIRRDLGELAEDGHLQRVHGGAILPSGVANIGYDERRGLNHEAKQAIADHCAARIPDDASVFLNIGTSTEAVAAALLNRKNLLVVTNNLNIANILVRNPTCDVVVAGGMLRRSDGGLVGHLTMQAVEQFKVDFAVVGCSALDVEGDILDFDAAEVGVSQQVIAQSRAVFLVADHSKFQRSAPVRIASLSDIDTFFTDRPLSPALRQMCTRWNTTIEVCV